jgi:lysozyme
MGVRAIDVSRHQGTIDWRAVKASGVQGAWIKVGGADGGTYRDSRAGSNIVGADESGIAYGTYYFAVPSSGSAVAQAQHAVGCGHGRGQLWPAVDVELNPTDLTREQLDRWTAEFCAEVKRLTGRESVVYCNASGGMDGRTFVGWTDAAARCPLWIANYGPNRPGTTPPAFSPALPTVWSAWAVWQFNDQTPVADRRPERRRRCLLGADDRTVNRGGRRHAPREAHLLDPARQPVGRRRRAAP